MPASPNLNHELLMALRNSRWARADRMVQQGASPRAVGRRGETALHHLARALRAEREGEEQSPVWARRLLDGGASIDALNHAGASALTLALDRWNEPLIVALLASGADPNAGRDEGVRVALDALASAVRGGKISTVERLLRAGFDVHRTVAPAPGTAGTRHEGLLEGLLARTSRAWGDGPLTGAQRAALHAVLDQGLLDRVGPDRYAAARAQAATGHPGVLLELDNWALRKTLAAWPAAPSRSPRRL